MSNSQKSEQNRAPHGSNDRHVAIDSAEARKASLRFALAFFRFGFCDRIAKDGGQAVRSLTLTLSLSRFVPDLRATMAWLRT